MFRRVLLALSTFAILLSAESRPTAVTHEEHRLEPRAVPFSPVIVPVSEPAMLLGRHYQVVKRDPSPLSLPSSVASQLAKAKGEAPPVPSAAPMKRSDVPMPRYVYERDASDTNYLSNVGPAPAAYPGYKPYDTPPPPASNSTANAAPDGGASHSPDDKKGIDGSERKGTAKTKGVTSKTYKSKDTKKHKSA
ncbi:uncharacterized protein PHACADRAFT_257182 [Phanerochaete carnosa HHB-10118-sp]|uniref:Uncharacterized protein n=1 Tax=Phanerochaete carnosa (strain HHB-10118-sp) TaxID=650164 RepID=K5VX09_PHACS|nr:uncharacterized protein PHACADRAFT_257182 [Phanerochaete carnosa HHB-10118-sp]EKM56108.1 hypothetical protein PHACADRAFT_257182 [Phanerochaete carnosa HHB-10118-sp]